MRRSFTKYLFEPAIWKIKRMPVLEQYHQYSLLQFSSAQELHKRQDEQLATLLEHVISNVYFFRKLRSVELSRLIHRQPRAALNSMPVLNKEDLKNCLPELLFEMGRGTFANHSGGSTGLPTKFFQDKFYQIRSLASALLFYQWAGKEIGDSHALIWGAERDLVKGALGIRQNTADFIGNRITLNAFRMTPVRMRDYCRKINRFKPRCIEGYAETLYEFALFLERNNLEVFSPASIVSSAGTLYPEMRAKIEKVFTSKVFNRYGSREAGAIAGECEYHDGLHVFGETTIAEVVGADGYEVGEGEEGEILITNLTNFTMPLIRYRIGDRAIKGGESCPCSRPYTKLQKVTGRTGSSFETVDGGVVSPEFFIHLIGVMHNDGRIGKFQVVQKAPDHIVVRIVPVDNVCFEPWNRKETVIRLIRTAMGGTCRVDILIEEYIEPTPSGKHLYTVKQMSGEDR